MRILSQKGTVKVFEESYKAFTTGKSDISENVERLFCVFVLTRSKLDDTITA